MQRDDIHVGVQMLIRNEADVIAETVLEVCRWGVDSITILDGDSDDGTPEVMERLVHAGRVPCPLALYVKPDKGGEFADSRRMELLELGRRFRPDWIISLDADEIYHDSPVDAIMAAEEEGKGANVIWCDVPQFWLTYADIRAGLLLEDAPGAEYVSIQKRRRWYSWGHTGVFIWKDDQEHFYPEDVPKRTPEKRGLHDFREWQIPGPVRAICKHYAFRTLSQSMKRQVERQERGGRRYFGKYFLDWIIDEYAAQLHLYTGAGWDTRNNHETVTNYMGRFA